MAGVAPEALEDLEGECRAQGLIEAADKLVQQSAFGTRPLSAEAATSSLKADTGFSSRLLSGDAGAQARMIALCRAAFPLDFA